MILRLLGAVTLLLILRVQEDAGEFEDSLELFSIPPAGSRSCRKGGGSH